MDGPTRSQPCLAWPVKFEILCIAKSGAVCPQLKTQTTEDAMKCSVPQLVKEDVTGCKSYISRGRREHPANHIVGLASLPGKTNMDDMS